MTKYPVKDYFLAIMFMLCIYFFLQNVNIGLDYFLFVGFCYLSLRLFKSTFYKGAYFVILFSITAAYFIRPLVLVNHPELYAYPKIIAHTDDDTISRSLIYAAISAICIGFGFIFCVKAFPDRGADIPDTVRKNDIMFKNFYLINFILCFLTIIRLVLAIVSGVGIKGDTERDVTFGFLTRLMSPDVSLVVYYIYLTRYWKRMSKVKISIILIMIAVTCFSILITGSKTFISLFGLCFFFDFIYRNKGIKVFRFIMLSIFGLSLIAFSFIIAAAVKFAPDKSVSSIVKKAQEFASQETFLTIGDAITQRMIGLDGMITVYTIEDRSNKLLQSRLSDAFSASQELFQMLDGILPKIQFTTQPNAGKIISEEIVGFDANKSHAGSLGLFAAVYYMTGPFFFAFNIILGIAMGRYFVFTRHRKNGDMQFILFFMGCYFILRLTLSGNFDLIFSEFLVEWILLYFYVKLISIIGKK